MPRKEGHQFSTDRCTLDLALNPNILIHCQRQRLLLELQYHHQCVGLYQPFICFAAAADTSTPVADGNATAGLYHAMALTRIMHQVLAASEALSGVYHVIRWQKTALFTMLAYSYAFPLSHARHAIRACVDKAIAVVEMYRDVLPDAPAVALTARALQKDAKAVVDGFYTGSQWLPSSSSAAPPSSSVSAINDSSSSSLSLSDNWLISMDPSALDSDHQTLDFTSLEIDLFPRAALGVGDDWDMADSLWDSENPQGGVLHWTRGL